MIEIILWSIQPTTPVKFFGKRSLFGQNQQPLDNVEPFERMLRALFIAQCPYKFSSFLDLTNCSSRLFARDFRLFRFFFSGSACFLKVAPPENLQSWVKYYGKSESFGKEFRWTKFNVVERVLLLQVIRFHKSILLILQNKYLKSCSEDYIFKNLILCQDHAVLRLLLKIVGLFISARQKSAWLKWFVPQLYQLRRGILEGPALQHFYMIHRPVGPEPRADTTRSLTCSLLGIWVSKHDYVLLHTSPLPDGNISYQPAAGNLTSSQTSVQQNVLNICTQ